MAHTPAASSELDDVTRAFCTAQGLCMVTCTSLRGATGMLQYAVDPPELSERELKLVRNRAIRIAIDDALDDSATILRMSTIMAAIIEASCTSSGGCSGMALSACFLDRYRSCP
jgi:hypothetical protein